MNFSWTPEQNRLRQFYSEFAKEHVAPHALQNSKDNTFDATAWQALSKTDFWKLIIPEIYGGHGEDWWSFTAALEGIASTACDGGFVLTVISQAGFIRGLTTFGTPSQCERIFPDLLQGAPTATAIAESHTGTATGWVKTKAESDSDGRYVLSGDKYNIAHASTAKYTLVVGRIPELGKRDITLFLVANEAEGFRSGPVQEKHGNRTIPTTWIELDRVKLTEDDILGKKGDGVRTLVSIVSIDRIYYGLVTAHLISPLMEKAWDFVQNRESFGQPVIDHQYVQRKITDAIMHCEQTRWTAYAALWQLLNNDPKAAMTSSIAKLSGAMGFEKSCRELITLLGSRGYLEGMPTHMMADALGFLWVGGTEEMHRINIFKQAERFKKQ